MHIQTGYYGYGHAKDIHYELTYVGGGVMSISRHKKYKGKLIPVVNYTRFEI